MANTQRTVLLRSEEDVADAMELRAAISAALVVNPMSEHAVRCAVWSFVGTERRAGVPPALVITRLMSLIEDATITPMSARLELTRLVTLWCVEEYFGRLGGDALGIDHSHDLPTSATSP